MMMEKKVKLKSVNPCITCALCKGYLIDATTITECLHTFCRSCLVRFLTENNTCPRCGIMIHQSHPLNYISFDRTMQDIVYKLVPNLHQKETQRQTEFYKKRGIPMPNGDLQMTEEDKKNIEKSTCDKEDDKDCHRKDEQVTICLECKEINHMKNLKRKFLRLSALATVTQLKKFIALKILNSLDKYRDVDILCNDELLGKDHMLKFIVATRWRIDLSEVPEYAKMQFHMMTSLDFLGKIAWDGPLILHYRQRLEL